MNHILYFLKQLHVYAGKTLYINLFAMVSISLLEGVGILLLIPMISMSGIVDLNADGTVISQVFGFLENFPVTLGLPFILLVYVLIVMGQNFMQRQVTIRNAIIQQGYLRQLRLDSNSSVLHAKWSFFLRKRRSDLVNLLTSEVTRASAGINSFLQFVSSLIFTIIQIGLALLLSFRITSFVLIAGLILLLLNRKILIRSLELGDRNFELAKSYFAGVTDQVNGMKDIKSNTLERSRMVWYQKITKRMQNEQVEYTRLKTTSQFIYKSSSAIFIAVFVFIAIKLFNAQAAQLLLILVIFSRLWPRITAIQGSLERIATTIPSLRAIKKLQQKCKVERELEHEFDQTRVPISMRKEIAFCAVSFKYNQRDQTYALKNINLVIPSNQMTAVVGRSGAGKSTLIDLIMGLNQPEMGKMLIDGMPLTSDNLPSLRKSISYVPQDPFLFNDSIRENLLLVEPNAREEQIWHALEFSSSAEFVRKLPDGLDTVIGDRGIKLSGGERQRLVLARAILRKPSILVLDEATSALDTENEARIQDAIDRLKGKMTIIVIAHRLSTIRNADQVVVLEEGEIVQQGGFNQLAKENRSIFSNLLASQMKISR